MNLPQLPLQAGQVDLWRCRLDRAEQDTFRQVLSADEMRRRERFKMPHLQTRFTVARGALRILAGRYLDKPPESLRFLYGAQGKPLLDGLHFNLSHSGDLMTAAFSVDGPLGIDIEEITPRLYIRDIASRYFSKRECGELETPDDTEFLHRFYRLWTAKEAVMKATALGFALELSKIEVGLFPLRLITLEGGDAWTLREAAPAPEFAGTLACRADAEIRWFTA